MLFDFKQWSSLTQWSYLLNLFSINVLAVSRNIWWGKWKEENRIGSLDCLTSFFLFRVKYHSHNEHNYVGSHLLFIHIYIYIWCVCKISDITLTMKKRTKGKLILVHTKNWKTNILSFVYKFLLQNKILHLPS